MLRVLVTGGRAYNDKAAVFSVLDSLRAKYGRLTVIEGGASGADALARAWCAQPGNDSTLRTVKADWVRHGRGAGPVRNQAMLDQHKPQLVVAFPGGPRTADMVLRALRVGVPVWHCPDSLRYGCDDPRILQDEGA